MYRMSGSYCQCVQLIWQTNIANIEFQLTTIFWFTVLFDIVLIEGSDLQYRAIERDSYLGKFFILFVSLEYESVSN